MKNLKSYIYFVIMHKYYSAFYIKIVKNICKVLTNVENYYTICTRIKIRGNFYEYSGKNIRNVVFAGHASKGKTTLCEALLNVAGTTERMGKTADANTVLDFDSEEKKKKSA